MTASFKGFPRAPGPDALFKEEETVEPLRFEKK